MVNLRAKPYCLNDADIAWVESTIASMTKEEKVGQLFWQLTAGNSEEYLKELMERFVRGDASRNAEGSGLGLNIAKSLMELQQGQLQLLVDGDLFKTSLIFPLAE